MVKTCLDSQQQLTQAFEHVGFMGVVEADMVLPCAVMADVASVVLSLFPGLFLLGFNLRLFFALRILPASFFKYLLYFVVYVVEAGWDFVLFRCIKLFVLRSFLNGARSKKFLCEYSDC